MSPSTCADCAKPASHKTSTSRMLCTDCYRNLAGYAGAGAAMIGGANPAEAIGAGIAAQNYAGSMAAESKNLEARRQKLAQTPGFWRRAWVRLIG